MTTDSPESATLSCVISIPGLGDAGVGLSQLLDEGEDYRIFFNYSYN